MDIILCTGDSHTWGQGASGQMESFSPPVVGGELRQGSFVFPNYVNELRRMINTQTGSYAGEDCSLRPVGKAPVILEQTASMFRMQFACKRERCTVRIAADDGQEKLLDLTTDQENIYRNVEFFFEQEGPHHLSFTSETENAVLCRAEWYGGSLAVVNSGVGSSSTARYIDCFWEDYVEALSPSLVIMEAHTINDWILADGPENYQKRLEKMIKRVKRLGSHVVLLTVSPIIGAQTRPYADTPYNDYVEASRRAAVKMQIPLCDANAIMSDCIFGMPEKRAAEFLFWDEWHVNDRGHRLYAQMIFQTLRLLHYLD